MRYQSFTRKNSRFACLRSSDFCIPVIIPGCDLAQAHAAARWARCGMGLVLPALFLARALRNVMGKKHFLRQFAWALPYMTIFALIGACGELVRYLCGPGNALARIE